ncbi:MAG: glutathione S-transferase family protein [Mesorhizobium sp.]
MKLFFHPLSSFSWKALIALYEARLDFEPVVVNFGDPASADAFRAAWPIGKIPAFQEGDRTIGEATIIIERIDQIASAGLLPSDETERLDVRLWDRVFDNYVHHPMQDIVADVLRPVDKRDPFSVEQARGKLRQIYPFIDRHLTGREWCVGSAFSMADISACPALLYANAIEPIGPECEALRAYLERLQTRPSRGSSIIRWSASP